MRVNVNAAKPSFGQLLLIPKTITDNKHFFFLGHTQDVYFNALGYETQSGMGFHLKWYYVVVIHWSSWS